MLLSPSIPPAAQVSGELDPESGPRRPLLGRPLPLQVGVVMRGRGEGVEGRGGGGLYPQHI